MFAFKKGQNHQFSAIGKVFKNIPIYNFVHKISEPTDIIICPTYAINVANNTILQERCISCALCWHKQKNFFTFDGQYDKNRLIGFCNKNKLFVYSWLSLILNDYSGIEIVSKGYSRTIRIPLLIVENDTLFIIKASHDAKDLEKNYREMEDIETLITNEIPGFKIEKISLLIRQDGQLRNFKVKFKDSVCLSLEKILDNLLLKGYSGLSNHLKYSRC